MGRIVSVSGKTLLAFAIIIIACLPAANESRAASAGSVWFDYKRNGGTTHGNAALVDVRIDQSADVTYYAAMVWNTGYMGLQRLSGTQKHVHFSVWDVDSGPQTEVVYRHPGTVAQRFGGEGTGYKTMHDFEWQVGVRYRMALEVLFQATFTDYAAHFYDPATDRWTHLATLRRYEVNRPVDSFASFVEDFGGTANIARSASYGNCWVRDLQGLWIAQNQASFFNNSAAVNLNAEPAGDLLRLATGGNTQGAVAQRQVFALPVGALGPLPASMLVGSNISQTVSPASLWGFGKNQFGHLGTGETDNHPTPVNVAANVVRVAAGGDHSLFIKADSTLWAMGDNHKGNLGDGSETARLTPVQVATDVVDVSAGGYHSAFVKADGTLWTMGYNLNGQLGNGTQLPSNEPFQVATAVKSVVAGWFFTLFLKHDGTLWGMGDNDYGQLGDGTVTKRLSPVFIASGIQTMGAGVFHSLFVKNDGTLWATGRNDEGQLGIRTLESPQLIPTFVTNQVRSVAAGHLHTLFVKDDFTLWAMGSNDEGQLGNGTYQDSPFPLLIAGNVLTAAAGNFHSLYTQRDGTVWSSGNNNFGQLGEGTTYSRNRPIQIAAGAATVSAGLSHSFLLAPTPEIATQPQSRIVGFGAAATFSVAATEYWQHAAVQWFKNGTPIANATNASLTIADASVGDMGRYWAKIGTGYGVALSGVATLTIPGALDEQGNHYLRTGNESEYLTLQHADAFNFTNGMSILFWFRADPTQPVIAGSGYHAIMSKWDPPGRYPFAIRFSDERASQPRRVQALIWDGLNNPSVQSPPNLDTNFHHVAFVRADRLLLLYTSVHQ
jgi:alpha-tubulin suppressor-like RCC1 family protein